MVLLPLVSQRADEAPEFPALLVANAEREEHSSQRGEQVEQVSARRGFRNAVADARQAVQRTPVVRVGIVEGLQDSTISAR